jgi:hypothetical protein
MIPNVFTMNNLLWLQNSAKTVGTRMRVNQQKRVYTKNKPPLAQSGGWSRCYRV